MTGDSGKGSLTGSSSDVDDIVNELKEEVGCTCGCGYTLEDCALYDPTCSVRPAIVSRIEDLAEQGLTKEEILDDLESPSQPSRVSAPSPTRDVSVDDDPAKGEADAPGHRPPCQADRR